MAVMLQPGMRVCRRGDWRIGIVLAVHGYQARVKWDDQPYPATEDARLLRPY